MEFFKKRNRIRQARNKAVAAGDKGLLVIQDVKSLTEDESDEILLGTYEGTLSEIIKQLPGDGDQPGISWQRIPTKTSRGRSLLQRVGLSKKHAPPTGHSVLLNSFINAIINGGEPIASGESARASVELINALFISAVRNKTVDLPIDPEEYDRLAEELSNGTTRVPTFSAIGR
jgi:hypothetical protein